MTVWRAKAPSNIAIIKYMGKKNFQSNMPLNSSISMTLSRFTSSVEVELSGHHEDIWEPLPSKFPLPQGAGGRFLSFLGRLKEQENIKENFVVRSANSFPSDCGLASSASSFAALTKASYLAFAALKNKKVPSASELAQMSKTGSGSSCRSFFSPWCLWDGDRIEAVSSNLDPLVDFVVISENTVKSVSSSEAHRRVQSSPLYIDRESRVATRTEKCLKALHKGDFRTIAEIAWEDMWEMHSMFHTSSPPFFYFNPATVTALKFAEYCWNTSELGPITTIDAGPNVHFLVKANDARRFREQLLEQNFQFLESPA